MAGADTPRVAASPSGGSAGPPAPRPRVAGEGQLSQSTGPPADQTAAGQPATPSAPPAGGPSSTESAAPEDTTGAPPTIEDSTAVPPTNESAEPAENPGRAADQAAGLDAWSLVQRAQGGDSDAFAQIYDRYVDAVYRYVYYRIGDRTQAEDFTSETFVRALRRLDSFTYRGRDLGAWLITIARNIIFDHVKSSRYRLEVVTREVEETAQVQEGPENAVLERLDSLRLLRSVQKLGSEQQECIVLRFLQGLSVAETAQIMGKQDGAIKALQHRAVRRLAGLLRDDKS